MYSYPYYTYTYQQYVLPNVQERKKVISGESEYWTMYQPITLADFYPIPISHKSQTVGLVSEVFTYVRENKKICMCVLWMSG